MSNKTKSVKVKMVGFQPKITDEFYNVNTTGRISGDGLYADVINQKPMKLTQNVLVPTSQSSKLNFTAKLLQQTGDSLRRLQDETECKIAVKGRNSMRNKAKEEKLRKSNDPRYNHLNKDLFLEISTVAAPAECYARIACALTEIRNYLIADENDEISHKELEEIVEIEPEWSKTHYGTNLDHYKLGFGKSGASIDTSSFPKHTSSTEREELEDDYEYDSVQSSSSSDDEYDKDVQAHDNNDKPITSSLAESDINKRHKSLAECNEQQTIGHITAFENINQIVETTELSSTGLFYVKDVISNRVTLMQTSNKTPLSRCLRRATRLESVFTPVSIETIQQNQTELVFEYTPPEVINCLVDNMKHYPVLWEFHYAPFNASYSSAIKELCNVINAKWSLNLSPLKMRSSVNRILKFYRYMLPCENIDKFSDYFDKCAIFLPSSVDQIPRARCLHCYVCYRKDSELRQHLIAQHEFLKRPYKCDHCPERLLELDDYELHTRLPHYVEIFKCQKCGKRFNQRDVYNKHLSSHVTASLNTQDTDDSNVKYVCKICHKEFKNASHLCQHQISHEEEKFKCSLCPKAFSAKENLKAHKMTHNKKLNFICELCGTGFGRSTNLRSHMKLHTGDDKVTCNICNLKLSRGSLSRHRRLVHVAIEGALESTYRAKSHRYSKKIVLRRNFLKRAKESGPRQYDCKVCKLPFERLKLLRDHNKLTHYDVELIPCKICNSSFRRKQYLKFHYREKHSLHIYQIYKIVEKNDDLNTVLAMTPDEAEAMYQAELKNGVQNKVGATLVHCSEQSKIDSAVLQDEIMDVDEENIDYEDFIADDEQ